jgi:hypothetical protein
MQRLPQVAVAKFDTHWPLHSWKPVLHWMPQAVPLQVAVPFTGTGHGVQLVPHEVSAVSDTHWVPHWWKPVAHVYWHCPATHCGFVAPAGGVHVWQVGPHEVADSARHWFPQRAKPGLHCQVQAGGCPAPGDMHWATEFAGIAQGWQRLPQVATSKSDTQSLPHWWKPGAHCRPQSLPSQVGVAFGALGQAVHRVPHVIASKFETHWFPQRW